MTETLDTRYNEPKGKPKVSKAIIMKTIDSTEIYREAKEYILNTAQPEQVGYGLDKYPEPLNADTWSIVETLDHIISESVDKLHYMVMLRIKFLRLMDEEKANDDSLAQKLQAILDEHYKHEVVEETLSLYSDNVKVAEIPMGVRRLGVMDGSSQHARLRGPVSYSPEEGKQFGED